MNTIPSLDKLSYDVLHENDVHKAPVLIWVIEQTFWGMNRILSVQKHDSVIGCVWNMVDLIEGGYLIVSECGGRILCGIQAKITKVFISGLRHRKVNQNYEQLVRSVQMRSAQVRFAFEPVFFVE